MKKVSILIPCFNEQDSLPLLYKALNELMGTPGIAEKYGFEVLLVNDGSKRLDASSDETTSLGR